MLIYLIGYMGSGKTTVGKRLAKKLCCDFIDLDALIEVRYHVSVNDLFKKYDENVFRKIEHNILKETFKLKNTVISTGGGTSCFYKNIELINNNGISVYLKMHINSLLNRLENSKKPRPLLQNLSQDKLKHYIIEQLKEREIYYNQSNIIVKGENADINEIINLISVIRVKNI
ncbi:MAG: shikimate kinase [Bacteroidales bacterium]|nr:shikimate kinase [Bacteroidales bacterium]